MPPVSPTPPSGLGKRICKRRNELGISAMQLAALVGVNLRTVYRLESGVQATTRHLLALARALKVSTDWLLTGRGTRGRVPARDSDAPAA